MINMVMQTDIISSLIDLVKDGIPELQEVYIDQTPSSFKRPSVLVELDHSTQSPAGANLLRCSDYLTITVFTTTNKHSLSSTMELIEFQQKIAALFRCGYLQVGSRALGVQASNGGRDWNCAFVDIQLEYFSQRTDIQTELPMMEILETNLNQKG